MDIYTRLPDGFKGKHCRLKCIQVLIQAFSAQPHMHLTVLRTMGSGAFCKHFALVAHGSGQKLTKSDAIVGQIAMRKVDTKGV
jgi:hypothetical protein